MLALGDALDAAGRPEQATPVWRNAAAHEGDFRAMAPQPFSEQTYFQVLACRRLGEGRRKAELLNGLAAFATGAPAVDGHHRLLRHIPAFSAAVRR